MPITVRSFAKINLGLCIGSLRPDGFHDLRTVYQTIALHDIIRVAVKKGSGIEVRCKDERVPTNATNTCYRTVEKGMAFLKAQGRVVIEIDKRLPVQGGLGGASGNAVATLLALEKALKKEIPGPERLSIAAEVGSDLPLFLVGGTVLGVGRGEEVYPLPDLPSVPCVIVTPEIGVSTPKAFADWDLLTSGVRPSNSENPLAPSHTDNCRSDTDHSKLTLSAPSDRMSMFGRAVASWLSKWPQSKTGRVLSGVPAGGRGRAETSLLDLVRTGTENDFERVVFPQCPELRDLKRVLVAAGAFYASLSGSGSALYGLFRTRQGAQSAAVKVRKQGAAALATVTLTRGQYWRRIFV